MFYVYMMSNWNNKVLYIGITNDLQRRVYEHKNKLLKGFTSKYNIDKLVYFEEFSEPKVAIAREKKNKLIESVNSEWSDLSIGFTQ